MRRVWTSQPPELLGPDRRNPVNIGLRRLIDARDYRQDLADGVAVTYLEDGTLQEGARVGRQGLGLRTLLTANNVQASVPSWTNVSSEASALLVFDGAAGNYNGWELGSTGQTDHLPFSGAGYTDAFWSSRWLNNIAAPTNESFVTSNIRILVTVRNGRQRAYWNGRLWHSNTLTGGFTLPANLLFFERGNERMVYLGAAWDRALNDEEAASVSLNPWQLLEPRRIWVPQSAASGLPTLSAATLVNAGGNTYQPRVTYTY